MYIVNEQRINADIMLQGYNAAAYYSSVLVVSAAHAKVETLRF